MMDHSLSEVGIGFGPGFQQKGKKQQRPTVPLVIGYNLQSYQYQYMVSSCMSELPANKLLVQL